MRRRNQTQQQRLLFFSFLIGTAAVTTLLACVGDEPLVQPTANDGGGGGNDAGGDATTLPDGSDTGTSSSGDGGSSACKLNEPWGVPLAANDLDIAGPVTGFAHLSDDERTVVFANEPGDAAMPTLRRIMIATRTDRNLPFSSVTPLDSVNTPDGGVDSDPMLAGDGLSIVFSSQRSGKQDLYAAKRPPGGDFGTPIALDGVNDLDAFDRAPFASTSDNSVWFSSDRNAAVGELNLFRAANSSSGVPANPQKVVELSSSAMDSNPVLAKDGLTIYWSSRRTDGNAMGNFDVWRATRTALNGTFGSLLNIKELNTFQDDVPTWLSNDGCRLYLTRSSDIGMSTNRYTIFRSEKPPL